MIQLHGGGPVGVYADITFLMKYIQLCRTIREHLS